MFKDGYPTRFLFLVLLCLHSAIVCANRSGRVVNLQQIQNRCLTFQSTAPRDRTCLTQKKLKMQITPNVEGASGVFYCLTYEKSTGPVYGFDTLVIQLHHDYDLQYSGANVIDYEFPSFKLYDVRVSEEYRGRFAIYSNNTAFKIYQVTINNEPQSCTYGRNKNRQKKWPEEKEPELEIEDFETEAEVFQETPKNVLSAIPETPTSSSSSSSSSSSTTTTTTTPEPPTTSTTPEPPTTLKVTTPEPLITSTTTTSTTITPEPPTTLKVTSTTEMIQTTPAIEHPPPPIEESSTPKTVTEDTPDAENKGDEQESPSEPIAVDHAAEKEPTEPVPPTEKVEQETPEPTTVADQKLLVPTTTRTTQRQRNKNGQRQRDREPTTPRSAQKQREPTTPTPTVPESTVPSRPLNEDNCGVPQKIVDFKQFQMPANPGQFPYAASIYHILDLDDIYGNSYYKCSGSIINRRMILTSVNCVLDHNARLIDANNLLAHVGQFSTVGRRLDSRAYDVEQVLPHDGYNYNLENNIAALRLKRSIEFDDFVMPVCLPEPSMDLEDDSIGKVVGFGKANMLSEGEYNISLDEECKDTPSSCKTINGNNTSGNVGSTDLGCGLFMNNSNHWIVIGVVSIVPHPLTQDFGCIFTNVLSYIDWINRLLI